MNYTKSMICPVCSFDYSHIEAVTVNRGGEITEVGHDGTKMIAGKPDDRGASVEILFWCESGHRWKHRMYFYKGQTFLDDIYIGPYCPSCTNLADLWRD